MGIDGTKTLRKRLSALSSVLAGMTPPFPALEVLREDVTSAQDWLDKTLVQISELELSASPSGRPPDDKRYKRDAEKVKVRMLYLSSMWNLVCCYWYSLIEPGQFSVI
mgnify:FL=1